MRMKLRYLLFILLSGAITYSQIAVASCVVKEDWFLAAHLNSVTNTPKRFGPNIISTEKIEFNSSMSSNDNAFYFSTAPDNWRGSSAKVSRFVDGQWTTPVPVDYSGDFELGADIHTTFDGHFFFKSYKGDIYRSKKNGEHWSKAEKLSAAVNSTSYESYAVTNCKGDLYFQRRIDKVNWDLYVARYKDGKYQQAEPLPANINTGLMEADVFVAPDESYMIFVRMRPSDGLGMSDLYISFKNGNTWSEPVNMGKTVNSKGVDGSPFVSPDGHFLFFTSNRHADKVDKFDGTLDIYKTY